MAITVNQLTSGSDTSNTSSYSTASISPGSNKLIMALVMNGVSSGGVQPANAALSGCGLTWVRITGNWFNSNRKLNLFRALGASPTTGALSITFGGETQTGALWSVTEFDGVDTSGTDGSGAIVQSKAENFATATSYTLTMNSSFSSPNNRPFAGIGITVNSAITEGNSFVELSDVGMNTPSSRIQTEWKNTSDNNPAWTFSSSAGSGVAVEIKASTKAIRDVIMHGVITRRR